MTEVEELADTNSEDDVALAYEKAVESIKRLELSKDNTLQSLVDDNKDLEYIKEWSAKQKDCIAQFCQQRDRCRKKLDELKNKGPEEKLKRDIEDQRRVNFEQAKFQEQQQREVEEAIIRQQKNEEEWFMRMLELQRKSGEAGEEDKGGQQTVNLQRYTITPFSGDYKDWLRFWNQFTVEIDESNLSEISKFHYLMELVQDKPRDKLLYEGDGHKRPKFIYCDSSEHSALKCTKVLNVADRRGILRQKKACFNCAFPGHLASTCRARACHKCGQKHHTSICQQQDKSSMVGMNNSLTEKGMSSTLQNTSAIHPTLLANIGGEQVRLMIDTGPSSSYICTYLITKLRLRPVRKERRCIEQIYGSMTKIVEVYKVTVESTIGNG